MKTTLEKIANHVGTIYGQDISTEIMTKKRVVINKPEYSEQAKQDHTAETNRIKAQLERKKKALQARDTVLEQLMQDKDPITSSDAAIKRSDVLTEIEDIDHQISNPKPIVLKGPEKDQYEVQQKIYKERMKDLDTHRGQAFNVIKGQCMPSIKMKHEPDYDEVMKNADPLELMELIGRIMLAQGADNCPFETVCDQQKQLLDFQQNLLSNDQWAERFNMKVDVGAAIGMKWSHPALLECVAQDVHKKRCKDLSTEEQQDVEEDAEERFLAHMFLRQSGKQHDTSCKDLKNDCAKNDDNYPKTRQQVCHLLDHHSKSRVVHTVPQEHGNSFAQRSGGGKNKNSGEPCDKKCWKDKDCYKCGKQGHPANHCPKKTEEDDDRSRSSKSTKSSGSSKSKLTQFEKRSEEHTSELQSPCNLVCRLLLEKKNTIYIFSH